MWRRLVALMRFERPNLKLRPLTPLPAPAITGLTETAFDPNPGNLRMFQYLPRDLKPGAPLVVTLHGCGQTAGGYDLGTGWCRLADQLGFAVLAPEQKAVNNPHTCFDWFNPEDFTRDSGEAASIAAMVQTMVATHALDVGRVFITGLSAGGAMTAVMLATYPELFAGGAIIAGLPFGAAQNVRDAMESMRSAPLRTPSQWGDLVRAASPYRGPWPRMSIWHGALDATVNINNGQALAAQWADLQGLSVTDAQQELVHGAVRLSWDEQTRGLHHANAGTWDADRLRRCWPARALHSGGRHLLLPADCGILGSCDPFLAACRTKALSAAGDRSHSDTGKPRSLG